MTKVVEASALMPLGPEETGEVFEGNGTRPAVELSDTIIAIEGYRMCPDGTPRYVHVGEMDPGKSRFTADTPSTGPRAVS